MTPAGFASAFEAHKAGRLDEAERGYRQVLAIHPKHADAWHLLGVIEQQRGRSAASVEHIQRALALSGPHAGYLTNLGITLEALGRGAESVAALEKAVRLEPNAFGAHFALANGLRGLGRLEDAAARYKRALILQPNNASAYNNLGNTQQDLGRFDEAVASYRRTVTLQPTHARAHYNLGTLFRAAGRLDDAAASFRQALSIVPDMAEAHVNLGVVLHDLGHLEQAIEHARKAIALDPKDPAGYNNLGAVQRDLGQLDEAMESYAAAIALHPDLAEARHNEGVALQRLGREDEALEKFQHAQNLKGDFLEAEQNAALIMLMRGDFKAGWDGYECRWRRNIPALGLRNFPYPWWRGERDEGAVLVWGEQGLGDKILYASMLPDLMAQGHAVVWETDARLVNLFERSFPGLKAVVKRNPPDVETQRTDIRWQSPLASLGRWLRTSAESFPKRKSYLAVDETRRLHYRTLLEAPSTTGPIIGISWISRNPALGHHKTLDLKQWAPILRMPGARFVDLQYGDTTIERAEAEAELGVSITHIPDLDLREDIDGVAALAAACDLVISVSNTTAHLAAAVGRPTWIIVPAATGNLWYWMRGSDPTPWYPTATIIRQNAPGQWQDVMARLCDRLQAQLQLQQIN